MESLVLKAGEGVPDSIIPYCASVSLSTKPQTDVFVTGGINGIAVVKSVEEIDRVLQKGKKNRSVGATLMNAGSSRSHSVFTIVIECEQGESIRVGKLNLVDYSHCM